MPEIKFHVSVLSNEIIKYLDPQPNQDFIDATLGDGGHTQLLLEKTNPNGKVMAFDLDQDAIVRASDRLKKYQNRIIFIHSNFSKILEVTKQKNFLPVNGIIFDLGLSTYQLQSPRGFSYQTPGKLDMKFDEQTRKYRSAFQIINEGREEELNKIFKNYGELNNYQRITTAIINQRKSARIKTSAELAETISKVIPERFRNKILAQAFQAIRIAVNNELENIAQALQDSISLLKKNGRIAVISFHSLEDRIVKHFFKQESKDCLCPPEMPICQCHHKASLKIITKKPIIPNLAEIKNNAKSRSAKLRVAIKI